MNMYVTALILVEIGFFYEDEFVHVNWLLDN